MAVERENVRQGIRLGQLLNGMALQGFEGDPEIMIQGLAYDSRCVKPGYLFIALRGHQQDGHDYIGDAIAGGAVALAVERCAKAPPGVSLLLVPDTRQALSKLALRFYQPPLQSMSIIGVTGTNGKTTTTYVIESILRACGVTTGVIGTVNYRFAGKSYAAPVTTPESLDLMRILRQMADADVCDVVMEVSSHALDQGRVRDIPFRLAVFTNLSRDHLDYHADLETYFQTKSRLFRNLSQSSAGPFSRAVINRDDPRAKELIALCDVPVLTYGLGADCDIRAVGVNSSSAGLQADLKTPRGLVPMQSPLIGAFNLYNLMAGAAAAYCLEIKLKHIASGIKALQLVPGRLEKVPNSKGVDVVVDYAHTPDALDKTLESLRPLTPGRLITVFGCGGDRDKGKRREMGLVAARASDLVIVTSDNPRSEDPTEIVRQVSEGVRQGGMRLLVEGVAKPDDAVKKAFICLVDRRQAIRTALRWACKGDFVLVAGKGHETYQVIGNERRPFDDREEVRLAAQEVS